MTRARACQAKEDRGGRSGPPVKKLTVERETKDAGASAGPTAGTSSAGAGSATDAQQSESEAHLTFDLARLPACAALASREWPSKGIAPSGIACMPSRCPACKTLLPGPSTKQIDIIVPAIP